MIAWWNALDGVLRMLYCIAIPSTILLLIQTVLSLAGGMDGGEGVDVSDTSGLSETGGVDTEEAPLFNSEADVDDLHDGSVPGDATAMRMLTMQTMVAFLTVFSWSTIAAIHAGSSPMSSIILGLVLGAVGMFLVAKLVQLSGNLVESGTMDVRNAIGETAQVYVPIAGGGGPAGKVILHVQGRLTEYGAVTHGPAIETGTQVRVVDVRGDLLVVELEDT